MQRTDSFEKTLMLGKIEGRQEGTTEYEMVGWHHQLDGHEFEQSLGAGDGKGSQASNTLSSLRWPHMITLKILSSTITMNFTREVATTS